MIEINFRAGASVSTSPPVTPGHLTIIGHRIIHIFPLHSATMHDLEPLDPAYVAEILSKPPFVTIPGVINVRDLGSYPSITFPGTITRPGHVYRSAEISAVTPEGTCVVPLFVATY
jgi:hypothetical protein